MNYKRSSKLLSKEEGEEKHAYEKETRFEYSVLTISLKRLRAILAPSALKQPDQVSASDLLLATNGRICRSLLYLSNKDGQSITTLGAQLALVYLQGESNPLETIGSSQSQLLQKQKIC